MHSTDNAYGWNVFCFQANLSSYLSALDFCFRKMHLTNSASFTESRSPKKDQRSQLFATAWPDRTESHVSFKKKILMSN